MSDNCANVVEIQKPVLVVELGDDGCKIVEIKEAVLEVVFPDAITINNPAPATTEGEVVLCKLEAASQININRVVALRADGKIEHADKDTPAHACDVIGVSRISGAIGALVEIVKFGKLTGTVPGTIGDNFFLGNNGALITTPPTTGTWLIVGTQMASTEILIRLGEPITQ